MEYIDFITILLEDHQLIIFTFLLALVIVCIDFMIVVRFVVLQEGSGQIVSWKQKLEGRKSDKTEK